MKINLNWGLTQTRQKEPHQKHENTNKTTQHNTYRAWNSRKRTGTHTNTNMNKTNTNVSTQQHTMYKNKYIKTRHKS